MIFPVHTQKLHMYPDGLSHKIVYTNDRSNEIFRNVRRTSQVQSPNILKCLKFTNMFHFPRKV